MKGVYGRQQQLSWVVAVAISLYLCGCLTEFAGMPSFQGSSMHAQTIEACCLTWHEHEQLIAAAAAAAGFD
jgi:hypothetical protein